MLPCSYYGVEHNRTCKMHLPFAFLNDIFRCNHTWLCARCNSSSLQHYLAAPCEAGAALCVAVHFNAAHSVVHGARDVLSKPFNLARGTVFRHARCSSHRLLCHQTNCHRAHTPSLGVGAACAYSPRKDLLFDHCIIGSPVAV